MPRQRPLSRCRAAPDKVRPGSRRASSAAWCADCSSSVPLMIVLEIDIKDVARVAVFEAKRQPPIAGDRHREDSGPGPLQRMKPAGPDQIADRGGTIDRVEDQAHALMKFRPDMARPPG